MNQSARSCLQILKYYFNKILFLCSLLLAAQFAFGQGIESIMAPGKLSKAHAKWEQDCAQCHIRFDRPGQSRRCLDCHKETKADVDSHMGYHGKMKTQACNVCHTEHKGPDGRLVVLDKNQFDHRITDFQLGGKHQKVECEKCHLVGKKYREAPGDCLSCHKKDDVHKGSLGTKCADCHTDANWKDTKFDHDKTRFPLTGKHVDTKCGDCHQNAVYKDTPRNCFGCHRKDDEQKGHKGQYGEKCETCHGTKAWKPSNFNHDVDTKYALRGKHKTTKCTDCHSGNLYRVKTPQDCYSCHSKDDKHKETLGKECGNCHTEKSWKEPAKFDHSKTAFPLLGKHMQTECKACHEGTIFKVENKECIACHKKDDKHANTLGPQCADCHTERDWKATRFDHDKTKFKLREKHATPNVKCDACHKDVQNMRNTPTDCLSCHRKDDKHEGTLGITCEDCHSDVGWKITTGRFDHSKTKFALRNAHADKRVKCSDCHINNKSYRDTPRDCYSCHKKDDKHEGQEGVKCESCHTDVNWKVERFDHNRARFVLTGKHIITSCKSCHETLRYKDARSECVACHLKEDKHKRTLGTKCESCHNARAWPIWDFDHDVRTKYRLDGEHRKVSCLSCHKDPAPSGKAIAPVSSNCYACHRSNDPHEGKFGNRCDQCHVTQSWKKIKGQSNTSMLHFQQWLLALSNGFGRGAAGLFW